MDSKKSKMVRRGNSLCPGICTYVTVFSLPGLLFLIPCLNSEALGAAMLCLMSSLTEFPLHTPLLTLPLCFLYGFAETVMLWQAGAVTSLVLCLLT